MTPLLLLHPYLPLPWDSSELRFAVLELAKPRFEQDRAMDCSRSNFLHGCSTEKPTPGGSF